MTGTTWVDVCYVIAALCFILALKGLSSPRGARLGNLVGAAGAVLAIVVTLVHGVGGHLDHRVPIIIAMAVGVVVAVPASRMVKMTAIPQMVAAFNGVGGAAAALVSLTEFIKAGSDDSTGVAAAVAFSAVVGAVSFTGSAVTFAKLQEMITGRPIIVPGAKILTPAVLVATVGLGIAVLPTLNVTVLVIATVLALVLGVLFVFPVGGADVPVVISLLNAFTGLTVAASGYVLDSVLLIVAGTLVGAAGTLLTQLMAQAMGRSLLGILFGAFRGGSTAGSTDIVGGDRAVRSAGPEDIAILLGYARKVAIVPGYGLAVAQAQHTARELVDLLESRGVEVFYAIHPVAGRMPGHMNVLLAEANVPYEQLREMDEANPEMASTDVAVVVGANDVVNPAARTDPGSPIYGMPILAVDEAANVVFMKRSLRPGFAGIDNALLYHPKTTMFFGDAKESLTKLVSAVKNL